MEKRKGLVLFAVAVLTTAAAAFGQDAPAQRLDVAKPVIGNEAAPDYGADAQLATCLIADNQAEITLAKLAQQRAKDKDVRQFADQMVKDHTDMVQKLERFAGAQRGVPATSMENRTAASSSLTAPADHRIDFVALHRQIGQRFLELAQRDLEEKEGAQFDKCYLGQQIGAHMHMLATLEVIRNQGSPDLNQVLEAGLETTKSHLDEAKKIAKSLEH